MANPQVENGHTRVANEVMDQLGRLRITGNQFNILVVIIRKTYGFQKKMDRISNVQICEATGLVKSTVSRAMKSLKSRGIIVADGRIIGLQKDWEKWEVSSTATFKAGYEQKVSNTATNNPTEKLAIVQPKLAEVEQKVSSPRDTQKKKETLQKKDTPLKKIYGEFSNVLLTEEEQQKLIQRFGSQQTENAIENLSSYMASRNKKYKSHYATILNWQRRDGNNAKIRDSRTLPKVYTPTPDYPEL